MATGMEQMFLKFLPDLLKKMGVNGEELNALIDWAKTQLPEKLKEMHLSVLHTEKLAEKNNVLLHKLLGEWNDGHYDCSESGDPGECSINRDYRIDLRSIDGTNGGN